MLVCPKCGAAIGENDVYCAGCGTMLHRVCSHCHALMPLTAKFCSNCGTKFEEAKENHVFSIPLPIEKNGFMIDGRDQQKYKMVKIGNQIWLAENFRFKSTDSFVYGNNEDMAEKYGRLYTWDSARIVAPPGWHLATRRDFNELGRFCKSLGQGMVGTMLKSKDAEWKTNGIFGPGTPGSDAVGFAAMPYGVRTSAGVFSYLGSFAYFWCADEENMGRAYYRHLSYFTVAYQECSSKKECAFSVRLVKNQ